MATSMKRSALEQWQEKYNVQPSEQTTKAQTSSGANVTQQGVQTLLRAQEALNRRQQQQRTTSGRKRERTTVGDVLSDPMYYAEQGMTKLANGVQDAATALFTPNKYAEQEQARLAANQAMEEAETPSRAKLAEGLLVKGADQAMSGLTATADWLLGNPLKALGWENNPVSGLNSAVQATKAANEAYYNKNLAGANAAQKKIDEYGTQVVAAVPDLLVALMTTGASAGAEGAGRLARGGAQLAGAEAAKAANAAAAVTKAAKGADTLRNVTVSMAQNPQYWTSFSRVAGTSYQEAKADGANEWQANMYALINGLGNAAIEVGGGIETMPAEMQAAKKPLMQWLKSAADEGKEEAVQGIVERGLQNLIYGKRNPLVSVRDENAVINPLTAAKEAAGGVIVGGILSAPSAVRQGVRNLRSAEPPATQNAAESRVSDAAVELDNLAENPETQRIQRENGQSGRTTSIDTDPATHTPEQMQVIREYVDAVDNDLVEFVEESIDNPGAKGRYMLSPVSDRAADAIRETIGVDAYGNKTVIESRMARHLWNRHGAKGTADKTMRDINDVGRVQYVLDNFDAAADGGTSSAYVSVKENGMHTQSKTVKFSKTIDGTVYVVEAVPDTAKRTNFVVSAYIEGAGTKKTGLHTNAKPVDASPTSVNAEALRVTSETAAPADVNTTIPQVGQNVKSDGLPNGVGAKEAQFGYREAPTQTHGSDTLYTDAERRIEGLRPEDSTHKVNSDAEVDRNAQERLEFDYDGEKADLFDRKQNWDDADTALAHQILEAEVAQARRTGDYGEVARLQRSWEAHGTEQGQALRQRGRFVDTPTAIVAEAADVLLDPAQSRKLPDAKRTEILDRAAGYADRVAALGDGSVPSDRAALKKLITDLNAERRTGGFFVSRRTSAPLSKALDLVLEQDGGYAFLRDVATAQVRSMSHDYAALSPLEAAKSIRYMSMLSKLNTTMRNLVGNNVFDPAESMSNNIATPLDMLISLRTGRRTTTIDKSWFSGAKRGGSGEATLRAYIETALDVDLEGTTNRWEQRQGRTFKMRGNAAERFLSSVEKWQRYMLTVTDEFQKGGIRAEQQRNIDSLVQRGLLEEGALNGWADETARQRTFQNDGKISRGLRGLRDVGNIVSFKDSRGGSFGIGDAIMPFAQVPGNVAGQFLNYSPAGLVRGTAEVVDVLLKGENATARQQAQAVRDFGRGVNGTALVTIFTALAAKGLLHAAGSDDKDKDALERAEGVEGTQINLSATRRWLRGESAEWRNGDDLMSIGFLEPINGDMAMGAFIAEAYKEDGRASLNDIASANAEAAFEAVMDLPAMSQLKSIGDNYTYSNADSTIGKVADTAVQFAGDTAVSFIPNALSGIAQGLDNGVARTTRTSDNVGWAAAAENTWNKARSKIPGLREALPASLDNWGSERKTTATPLQNWFNVNFLPGSITKYNTNRVNQELARLAETQEISYPARSPEKTVQAGDEKKTLTTAQQRTYQQTAGSEAYRNLQALVQSAQYGRMTNAERAAAWNAIMNYAQTQAKQKVGGSAETPSWAGKSDGSVAQNAAYNAIYQAARQTLPDGDQNRIASKMQAVTERGLSYEDTVHVFQQFMDEKQLGKVQQLYDLNYSLEEIAAFWSAKNELSTKAATQAWAIENGYTQAQFNTLWNIFQGK